MPETSPRPDVPTSTLPAPQPTHPVAGRSVTDEAPEFRWTALPDAETYRLQLSDSEAFDPCYYDETVDGPTTVSLPEVLPDEAETVVWRVRAETGPDAPWSGPASFTRAEAEEASGQFLVDAPPVPIRPIQGDAVDAGGATFTWEGVPEASGYRVQVASSTAFDAPLVDLTLDQTTQLTLFEELPQEQSPLYWRLRALFPNNTEGPWSEVGRFGTDPDVVGETPAGAEGPTDAQPEAASPERSAVAAGPAREARTSSLAAIIAIGVLVVSFLVTIVLIMLAL